MSDDLTMWAVVLLPFGLLLVATAGASLSAALGTAAAGRGVTAVTLLQPAQEASRLLVVRRRRTRHPDALLWRLGGGTLFTTAVLAAAVVPIGDAPVVRSEVGVVWFNAAETLLWAALWLTGWGANSVAGLIGGYRFLAQALAYELPMMLALITAAIGARSLDVVQVAAAQEGLWFVVWMPVAFVVFLIAALALAFWDPFSQPVSSDASGGVLAELSGVDRLVVLTGRYAWLAAAAGMSVPLFLGAGAGPLWLWWLWWLWWLVKTTPRHGGAGVSALTVAGDPGGPVRGDRLGGAAASRRPAGARGVSRGHLGGRGSGASSGRRTRRRRRGRSRRGARTRFEDRAGS